MFLYRNWEKFSQKLDEAGIHSVTAECVTESRAESFLILKHDVETNPQKALEIAKIENKYGHRGVYYVQGYLLDDVKNKVYTRDIFQRD